LELNLVRVRGSDRENDRGSLIPTSDGINNSRV